jgi:hypothetical protein
MRFLSCNRSRRAAALTRTGGETTHNIWIPPNCSRTLGYAGALRGAPTSAAPAPGWQCAEWQQIRTITPNCALGKGFFRYPLRNLHVIPMGPVRTLATSLGHDFACSGRRHPGIINPVAGNRPFLRQWGAYRQAGDPSRRRHLDSDTTLAVTARGFCRSFAEPGSDIPNDNRPPTEQTQNKSRTGSEQRTGSARVRFLSRRLRDGVLFLQSAADGRRWTYRRAPARDDGSLAQAPAFLGQPPSGRSRTAFHPAGHGSYALSKSRSEAHPLRKHRLPTGDPRERHSGDAPTERSFPEYRKIFPLRGRIMLWGLRSERAVLHPHRYRRSPGFRSRLFTGPLSTSSSVRNGCAKGG